MNNSDGIKRNKDNLSKNYIENIIFPLTEILECIDELEIFTSNLSRMEFFENKDNVIGFVQEYLIRISASLDVIKETKPTIWKWLLKKYEKIPWEKYIKIGKAIDKGYWALVYSLAWNMASIGVMDVKKVVITILKLKPSKNEIDFEFF